MNKSEPTSTKRQLDRTYTARYREKMRKCGYVEFRKWVHKDNIQDIQDAIATIEQGANTSHDT